MAIKRTGAAAGAAGLRIATWNINSLRLRGGLLNALVKELRPDILCLQETKVPDDLFPLEAVQAAGFPHMLFRGMKAYNGVAILSRLPITPVDDTPDWCARGDCRHLAVRVAVPSGALTVHNFYVPAGGDVPDPKLNDKFAHKLQFIREMTEFFGREPPRRSVLLGDLNIAPLEHDVWSHRQLLDVVSHTPVETEALLTLQKGGFHDAVRHFVAEGEKLYTWWSYRNRDWRASDRGRRLDHAWVSDDLASSLLRHAILKDARDWQPASDHVPVCVEISV